VTKSLLHSMDQCPSRLLPVTRLVKKFRTSCGTPRFIIESTRSRHWGSLIQTHIFFLILSSHLHLRNHIFSLCFSTEILCEFPIPLLLLLIQQRDSPLTWTMYSQCLNIAHYLAPACGMFSDLLLPLLSAKLPNSNPWCFMIQIWCRFSVF
jgi:hypothetical protein